MRTGEPRSPPDETLTYRMNRHAILTITAREVRETLGDWRLVLPIGLLTFVLPLLLVSLRDRLPRGRAAPRRKAAEPAGELRSAELALDDYQRHALAREFDGIGRAGADGERSAAGRPRSRRFCADPLGRRRLTNAGRASGR